MAPSAIAEMVMSFFSGLCIERNLTSGKTSSNRKIDNFMTAVRAVSSSCGQAVDRHLDLLRPGRQRNVGRRKVRAWEDVCLVTVVRYSVGRRSRAVRKQDRVIVDWGKGRCLIPSIYPPLARSRN
jgi:hypothetical protein